MFSTLGVVACHTMHLLHSVAIQPNLDLKTRPKQLLGYLLLDIMPSDQINQRSQQLLKYLVILFVY